jgi:hypothetical protein
MQNRFFIIMTSLLWEQVANPGTAQQVVALIAVMGG